MLYREASGTMLRSRSLSFVLLFGLVVTPTLAAELAVEQTEDGVTVTVDGKLFTRYLMKSGAKPILWPVMGPTGKEMTRAYPMRKAGPDERDDHVHHRSFWFTHGDVNGVDFWAETPGHGNIVHREFVEVTGGDKATIVTKNDWVGPDGKKICEDVRRLTFGADRDSRWVDFDVTVTASEGEVKFGDTKEGSFGVRVAGPMKVTSKKGGTIINSNGQRDAGAWGKAAKWVDYSGPVAGETVGVAILNHPSSFRYPTYWHVRTYGLFTANPFGLHHFKGSNDVDGSHTLKKGESFTLRHRVLFHRGDAQEGRVSEAFADYASQDKAG